jgi:hypothetical protein
MTAEAEYEDMADAMEPLAPRYDAPPPESPFSLTFRMLDASGCEVQATIRAGVTVETVAEVMKVRKQFVESAQRAGWTFTGKPQPAPTAAPATTPAANGAWVPPAPTGPVAQNVAGGGFATQERQTFVAVKMTVTPRADGKTEVGWFEAGHQWADVRAVKTPQDFVGLLARTGGWTLEHFTKVGEYGVQHLVEWVPSANLNKSGKPYKNLVNVSPVA